MIASPTPPRIPGWLPDLVTVTRIALAPAFVLAAEAAGRAAAEGSGAGPMRALTVLLLTAIAASDRLDGWLARRSVRGPTRRGAILDAAADRLIQWTGAVYFAFRAGAPFTPLPLWFPALLLGRDLFLLVTWLRRRTHAADFEHAFHGKATTVLVLAVLIGAALGLPRVYLTVGAALAAASALNSSARYAARMTRRG